MVKRWIIATLSLTMAALYAWDKPRFVSTLKSAADLFFEWLSLNPLIIYLIGAFVFAFASTLWRSQRNALLET